MIPIPSLNTIGLCVALCAGAWLHGCQHGKAGERAAFEQFKAQAAEQGRAAQQRADEQAAADKLKKEQADEQNRRDLDRLRADADRLRDDRARAGYVPAAPASARDPETACFDRPELERAIANLDAGLSNLAGQGDEARVNLDAARRWAAP